MAIKAVDVFVPTWYVPKSEETAPTPTRFHLRGLTGLEKIALYQETKITAKGLIYTADALRIAIRHGLVGWENFNDTRGAVVFSGDPDANVDRLSDDLVIELARRIIDLSTPSESERKN